MNTPAPSSATAHTPSTGDRRWTWPILGLVMIVVAAAAIWWFGIRDTGSETADPIHGTWYMASYDAYETLDSDGTWSVRQGLEESAHDWGTYTLEDGVLTYFNADDSYCPGSVAMWEVTFAEDGDELQRTFVSDTCTKVSNERDQDMVWVRHTP